MPSPSSSVVQGALPAETGHCPRPSEFLPPNPPFARATPPAARRAKIVSPTIHLLILLNSITPSLLNGATMPSSDECAVAQLCRECEGSRSGTLWRGAKPFSVRFFSFIDGLRNSASPGGISAVRPSFSGFQLIGRWDQPWSSPGSQRVKPAAWTSLRWRSGFAESQAVLTLAATGSRSVESQPSSDVESHVQARL